MIVRIWHGWTTHINADAYEHVLTTEVIPQIKSYGMDGYRGIKVLRREHADEVEFITQMTFDSLDNIAQFVGDNYEEAHVPESAQKVLSRYDSHAQHYEVRNNFEY